MKVSTLYTCEFCNTSYKTEKQAVECEKHHRQPTEIKAPKYRSIKNSSDGYPDKIMVVFDDGQEIRYTRG